MKCWPLSWQWSQFFLLLLTTPIFLVSFTLRKKKSLIMDLSCAMWSKKPCPSAWLDRHTILLCSLSKAIQQEVSKYFPSSALVQIIVVCWNVIRVKLVFIGGKKNSLFLNNFPTLWSFSGNLLFFSVSSTCTSVMSHSPILWLSNGVRGCVVRI